MLRFIGLALILATGVATASGSQYPVSSSDGVELQILSQNSGEMRLAVTLRGSGTASDAMPALMQYPVGDGKTVPAFARWVEVPAGMSATAEVAGAESQLSREADQSVMQSLRYQEGLWQGSDGQIVDLGVMTPPAPVQSGRVQTFRGVRLVPLVFFPQQVSPTGETISNSRLTVTLHLVPDRSRGTNSSQAMAADGSFGKIVNLLTGGANPPPRRDLAGHYTHHMLILYPQALDDESALAELDSFVTWKERIGFKVSREAVDTDALDADGIKEIVTDYYQGDPPIDFLTILGDDRFPDPVAWDNNDDPWVPWDFDQKMFFPGLKFDYGIEDGFSDLLYATMDGEDDLIPDIAVGRFWVPKMDKLAAALRRSVLYEKEPYMGPDGDGAWYRRAVAITEMDTANATNPAQRNDLRYWSARAMSLFGYQGVNEIAGPAEGPPASETAAAETEKLESGVSLILADGWVIGAVKPWMDADVPWTDPAATGRMNPFIVASCPYYQNWLLYMFFGAGSVDEPVGPAAALTMTRWDFGRNISFANGATVLGLTNGGLTRAGEFGVLTAVLMEPLLQFAPQDDRTFSGDLKGLHLYGDPSLDIFTDVPKALQINVPDAYAVGATGVNLAVTDAGNNPVPDATVCIRQINGLQYVASTTGDGSIHFTVPEGLAEGQLQVTVSGHNLYPFLDDVPVETPEVNLVLNDPGFDDSEFGDNDGKFRNGEEVVLQLGLNNSSAGNATAARASFTSDSPYLAFDPADADFGDIAAGETAQPDHAVLLTLDPVCPGGTIIQIRVSAESDQGHWDGAFELTTSGPKFFTDYLMIDKLNFNPDSVVSHISPRITNVGDLKATGIQGVLVSLDSRMALDGGERQYDDLAVGDTASPERAFHGVFGNDVIRGDSVHFELQLSESSGYSQVITFALRVEGAMEGTPLGPDSYGYVCYDSGDEGWPSKPVYRWREINWDIQDWEFNGKRLDLGDLGGDPSFWSASTVVPLPISFRYYGQEVDSLVVNSNGWLSVNPSAAQMTSGFNTPIPGHAAPDGQICPLWDDLENHYNGFRGVFYQYIENEGMFVVEWSGVTISETDANVVDREVSFQVLLYDSDLYPTPTGDGEIVFQYQKFLALPGADLAAPYATVGLRNLTGNGGLQYCYANEYPESAHPLQDHFALKFTTILNQLGAVRGRVVRQEGQQAVIPGAIISHPHLTALGQTDESGQFLIGDLFAGHYEAAVAGRLGFNNTAFSFDVAINETTNVGDIALTHPEIEVTNMTPAFDQIGMINDSAGRTAKLTLANLGNGSLEYHSRIVNKDGSEPIPEEDVGRQIDSLAILTKDIGVYGVAQVDTLLYLPGRNRAQERTQGHRIYAISHDGALVKNIKSLALNESKSGIYSLTWDGQALWGSYKNVNDETHIIRFDTSGTRLKDTAVTTFPTINVLALAFDPERGVLYAGDGTVNQIYVIDTSSVTATDSLMLHFPGGRLNVTGLAWNPYDLDGMNLYMMVDSSQSDSAVAVLYKMNVTTYAVRRLGILPGRIDTYISHRGLALVWNWDYSRTLVVTVEDDGNNVPPANGSNDILHVYDIGPNLALLPDRVIGNGSGSILAGDSAVVELHFAAPGWPQGLHEMGLQILNNTGDMLLIPVVLNLDTANAAPPDAPLPRDFAIRALYPNPFNSQVRLDFALDRAAPVKVIVYDLLGREVATILDGRRNAGVHRVVWDGSKCGSGVYFVRLLSQGRARTAKMVMVK